MRSARAGRVWREGTVVLPIVQGRLFITAPVRGGIAGYIPADSAVEADDFGVGIEERLCPGAAREYTDHVRHPGDDAVAELVVFVDLGKCRRRFCIFDCSGRCR